MVASGWAVTDELIGGVDDERWNVRLKNLFFGSLTTLKSSIFLEVGLTSGQASGCCLFLLLFLLLPLATGGDVVVVSVAVVGTSFASVGIGPSEPTTFLPDSRFESERLNVADIRALNRDKEKRWKRGGFLLLFPVVVVLEGGVVVVVVVGVAVVVALLLVVVQLLLLLSFRPEFGVPRSASMTLTTSGGESGISFTR
jgi:hypothetical protein